MRRRPGSDRLCRARHADKSAPAQRLIGVLPLRDLRQRVGTRNDRNLVRVLARQVHQRIDRHGRPTSVNVHADTAKRGFDAVR